MSVTSKKYSTVNKYKSFMNWQTWHRKHKRALNFKYLIRAVFGKQATSYSLGIEEQNR